MFIDKDGTLIENVPFNVDPAQIRLVRRAGPALASLASSGYALVVVTNQPGIAQGRFAPSALEGVRARIDELLSRYGVALAGFYHCPHDGGEARPCACRKPAPGMLVRAAAEMEIDLARSWMLGDILDDVEAGRRAGCRSALVDHGNEDQWVVNPWRVPDVIVPDLAAASGFILRTAERMREVDA